MDPPGSSGVRRGPWTQCSSAACDAAGGRLDHGEDADLRAVIHLLHEPVLDADLRIAQAPCAHACGGDEARAAHHDVELHLREDAAVVFEGRAEVTWPPALRSRVENR